MKQPSKNIVRRHVALIVSGYVVIIALLGITTKIGLDNLNSLNESLRTVVQQNNIKAKHIDSLIDAIRNRMLLLHTSIHLDDPFEIDEIGIQYSLLAGKFILARENLIKMSLTKNQQQQLENQRQILAEAQPLLDGVINAVREEDKASARSNILKAQQLNDRVINDLQSMKALQQTIAETAVSDSAIAMKKARTRILLLIIATILLSSAILIIVVMIITRQGAKEAFLLHQLEQANADLEQKVINRTEELLKSREENARMGAELAVTHQLQQMILPATQELEDISELSIVASMSPAEEAGGDYYDVLQYNERIIISVGDVTGHGLESSVVMMMIQTAVRTMAVNGETNLVRFVSVLNKIIYDNLQRINSHKNLTFMLTHFQDGVLTICGQHEELLVIRKGAKEIERIDTIDLGFPLGLEENIESFVNTIEIPLEVGDTVVFYTDGIPEAEDTSGNFYGIDRLCEQVIKNVDLPVKTIHENLITDLHEHIQEQEIFDDITLMIVRRDK
ncbi:MAG: PP2C family protein-serine/threonine phosphatase [Pseudomonadota bacterium]